MRGRCGLIVVVGCLLASCAMDSPRVWKNNYSLQPAPQSIHRSLEKRARLPVTVRVAPVQTPQWLDSRELYYQLLYSNPGTLSAYSESRWLATPPTMLESLLVEELARAGRWRAVVGSDTDTLADYTVQLHLSQFQQVFKSRNESYGLLSARGSLIDVRRDSVIAQRTFRFEVVAPSADAAGGAHALSKASQDLIAALEKWLEKNIRQRIGAPRSRGGDGAVIKGRPRGASPVAARVTDCHGNRATHRPRRFRRHLSFGGVPRVA